MSNKQNNNETHTFRAEIRQLLNILAHSLYTQREIFLRELISNASDALNRVQFEMLTNHDVLDPDAELAIRLEVDEDAGTLTVSDTGIGMTRDELADNLGVIAHSGVQAFLDQIEKADDAGPSAADMIGQFGVGFYAVFMVADSVTVVSRSCHPDEPAYRWVSEGDNTFTLSPADKETRGTDIILKLKDDAREYLQEWKLREIVQRHSDFVAYPIYMAHEVEEEGESKTEDTVLNQQTALWRRPARDLSDEDYEGFYRQFTLDFAAPLAHIHMSADAPLQFYALLFVPASAERNIFSARKEPGLKLYARKVLIQEYCTDLLPEYLNFVHGVVDSEDIPLNISRETFQATRQMARLKSTITRRVLSELQQIATDDAETYAKIWAAFGRAIKQGIATTPGDKDKLVPLLRFRSSKSTGEDDAPDTSLADYTGRMATGQTEIYYVFGDDPTSIARSPHLDPFRRRGIEVLYMTDPIDSFMTMALQTFEDYPLRNIDDAGLDISDVGEIDESDEAAQSEALPTADFEALRARFADVLGERVVEVRESKVLTNSAARLVTPEDTPDRNMQRVYRALNQDYEVPKKIMEINPRHPLLHNLATKLHSTPDAPVIAQVIEQIYESALLVDGLHPDPARMVDRITALMEAATATE